VPVVIFEQVLDIVDALEQRLAALDAALDASGVSGPPGHA
jgi:hypothetical protein